MINPPDSKYCVWRSGPPPEIGWWPASFYRDPGYLRYWDGRKWSLAVHYSSTSVMAGSHSVLKSPRTLSDIEWTDRWWQVTE